MLPQLALVVDKLQPPTNAFADSVRRLCADPRFDAVLVLVAGAERARGAHHPLRWHEAAALLAARVDSPKLVCLPLVDCLYDEGMWVANVRRCVDALSDMRHMPRDAGYEVTLAVSDDAAGRNLARLFLDWTALYTLDKGDGAYARAAFLDGPQPAFLSAETWNKLQTSRVAAHHGLEGWAAAETALGHPIPLQTVDAVVVQSHHVLLARRGEQEVGAGKLCLPGLFLQPHGTALDTALDAARVKAGLDMPLGALQGRLRERRVFDHPARDPRGWIRTEAFVFELPASGRFEKAKLAVWTPLSDVHPYDIFADHFDIIQATTRGVPSPQDALLLNLAPL
jgi:bifunctional NMN adenylyltransferase/nudix hydrolase